MNRQSKLIFSVILLSVVTGEVESMQEALLVPVAYSLPLGKEATVVHANTQARDPFSDITVTPGKSVLSCLDNAKKPLQNDLHDDVVSLVGVFQIKGKFRAVVHVTENMFLTVVEGERVVSTDLVATHIGPKRLTLVPQNQLDSVCMTEVERILKL